MSPAVIAAWAVHFYTGFGAVLGFLALENIARAQYGWAFFWMAVATAIDITDGALARRARVKQVLPRFDGARLDDIVDYLNYVVVPVVLAYHAGLIAPGSLGLAIGSLPLLASGYGFCQLDAKTDDHFFTGFPSYWNIVVFYFYALGSPLWFNIATVVIFSILVFVPIRYLYPSRNPIAQKTTYVLGIGWGVCMFTMFAQFPTPSRQLAWLSLYFPIYYMALSVHLHVRKSRVSRIS